MRLDDDDSDLIQVSPDSDEDSERVEAAEAGGDDEDPPPRPRRRSAPAPSAGESATAPRKIRARPRGRSYYLRATAAGAAALGLVLWLWSTSFGQRIYQQSFTHIPAAYTELYFTSDPSLDGLKLLVPITVDAHNINVDTFTVKLWLVDGKGKTDYQTTVKLTPTHGVARSVVTLPLPVDAEVLWVNLNGQSRTLHYRVAGSALPAPTS